MVSASALPPLRGPSNLSVKPEMLHGHKRVNQTNVSEHKSTIISDSKPAERNRHLLVYSSQHLFSVFFIGGTCFIDNSKQLI